MTHSDLTAETPARGDPAAATFAAGFEFMRRLREPQFREFLRRHGWEHGEHVVMAADDEPVIEVIFKVMINGTGGRVLVAIPDERQRLGFRLLSIEVSTTGRRAWALLRRAGKINVGPGATIGMLYDAFSKCGQYMPSEWTSPVTVRKEPEPA